MTTIAEKRWQHIKDRALKEGVPFKLTIGWFETAIAHGTAPEHIFPDDTPEDRAAWRALRVN